MMAFSMAHLSVWLLRIKEPDTPRPYSARPNIRIANRSISVTATLGFLACLAIWLWMALGSEHTFGRNIGLAWVCVGLIFYVWYRRREGLDLTRPAVKEALSTLITTPPAPRRQQMTREIRHILNPVHSREYAEELARIACDLSGLYVAKITAVYAIEVPRALPLDADLAERAREADGVLEVAAHIADTVYDRAIEIVTLQARSAGAAIVEYAAEKQVDLILLSANPERARTKDAIVFSTTADYVARNAPCMVWTIRGGSPNSARPQEPHPRPGSSDT
jgi:APA family basic amino acid/polyamine antiporter